MENPNLTAPITGSESELKQLIIDYTGNRLQPESDEITVQQIIEIFAQDFPEFILALAEENWISGYTQALEDLKYTENYQTTKKTTENEKLFTTKEE
tara:strand:+ start:880 stop:1170 length:291 start_codon:yes stop_codon:yes gene_type:complete